MGCSSAGSARYVTQNVCSVGSSIVWSRFVGSEPCCKNRLPLASRQNPEKHIYILGSSSPFYTLLLPSSSLSFSLALSVSLPTRATQRRPQRATPRQRPSPPTPQRSWVPPVASAAAPSTRCLLLAIRCSSTKP
jgi:hypothetical protein